MSYEESIDNNEFPGISLYENKKCCFIDMIYYPKIKKYFWGEWEFQPIIPIIVLIIICGTYYLSFKTLIENYTILTILSLIFYTFLFFIVIISYLKIIIIGPGYLPFYYSKIQEIELPFSIDLVLQKKECHPSGIFTNNEQYQWAHTIKRPNRCVLSQSANRIVVRPDHVCGWTTVWIGKKNYKFFMLFTTYSFLYSLGFLLIAYRYVFYGTNNKYSKFTIIISVLGFFSISFLFLNLIFSCSSFINACNNETSLEQWNDINSKYDFGFIKNMEDVCGSYNDNFKYWFCPISPWNDLTIHDLANLY